MWYYCNSFKIWKSLIRFFYYSCGLIRDSTKWNEYAEWLIHHSIECSLNWSAILILNESVIRLTATTSITSNVNTPCPNRSSDKHTNPSFIRRMFFVMLFRVPFSSFKSYFYEGVIYAINSGFFHLIFHIRMAHDLSSLGIHVFFFFSQSFRIKLYLKLRWFFKVRVPWLQFFSSKS